MLNDAAVLMLGLQREDVLDKPFGQVFMVEMEGNDDFAQAILDAVYTADAESKSTVVFTRPDGTTISLSMSTAYLRAKGEGGHFGVIVGFDDISTMVQYQENEKTLNRELTKAVVKAEETNANLEQVLKKVQVIRVGVTLLIALSFAGGGYYLWNKELIPTTLLSGKEEDFSEQNNEGISHAVVLQPISSSVSLSGAVAPLEEINILAPFEGKVKEEYFSYDQRVKKDTLLLTMNTSTLEKELRSTRSKFIQAEQKLRELLDWQKGTEVASARRSLTKAKMALDNVKKKVDESELLFQKDIIAKSELAAAKNDFFNHSLDFKAAEEELEVVLSKGGKIYIDLARLELDNARFAMDELEQELHRASLRSPVAGVVLRPQDGEGPSKKNIAPGISVHQGEKLFSIGNMDGYTIHAKADQADIGKIRRDQEVIVRGTAFLDTPLTGRVTHVSSNAVAIERGAPKFDVIVTIVETSPDNMKEIRLGMTANVEIGVYNNPSALLIPLGAVMIRGDQRWVTVKNHDDGSSREVEVKTGMTTMDSVEILDGLTEGDRVYF